MKKYFGIFVMSVMVCGLMSCGNSKTSSQSEEDDTVTVTARSGSESEGFGRCFESGCYCKAFKGRGQTCANCGHAYRRHY